MAKGPVDYTMDPVLSLQILYPFLHVNDLTDDGAIYGDTGWGRGWRIHPGTQVRVRDRAQDPIQHVRHP